MRYLRDIILMTVLLGLITGNWSCSDEAVSEEENVIEDITNKTSVDPLFTLLKPEYTGVRFVNIIKENEKAHYMAYINVYNGGGVALGDINNDSLIDIYFTSNQGSNKLFLNKGNMQFEDITATAMVTGEGGWSTGVTMVDINGDGFMDIYVTRSFHRGTRLCENLLYINNGDLTFSEQGVEYGVNDHRFGIQSLFLDFDLDGDLDLFVGNFPHEMNEDSDVRLDWRRNPTMVHSDQLYKNMGNGKFENWTEQSGIMNSGFTLGIASADLNNDGWPDIYVANDHEEPDNFYINNGDGTFTDVVDDALKHLSSFAMGVDLADFNNDGWIDILTVDMLAEDNYRQKTQMSGMAPDKFWFWVDHGFHYQYMRNTLQLNNRNGTFSEIGQFAGITNSDWSWATFFADFDNDGYKDVFIANGFRRDIRDNDLGLRLAEKAMAESDRKLDLDLDEYLGMMLETRLLNYYFKNNGDMTFTKQSEEAGFVDQSFSNGAAYGDLDNDGDLDLVIANMEDPAFIYRNNAEKFNKHYLRFKFKGTENNTLGIGTRVIIEDGDMFQMQEFTMTRGYQSSMEEYLHFGTGDRTIIEKVTVKWPDGKIEILSNVQVDQVIYVDHSNAQKDKGFVPEKIDFLFTDVSKSTGIQFVHKENKYDDYEKEILLPHKMSQFGPSITVGDVNGDGLDDFYVGGASWQAGAMYLQNANSTFDHTAGPWDKHKTYEDLGAALFDADGDGDLDLYVVSGGNEFSRISVMLQDRLYMNDGTGQFSHAPKALPDMKTSGSCVVFGDYDNDGDQDLFVGGRVVPGRYPFPAKSYILRNDGGTFVDVTPEIAPALVEPGLVTSAVWTDFNKDGTLDLIVVGEWMPVSFYANEGGKFKDMTSDFGMNNSTGWWNKIVASDMDGDGDDDYVLGNLGLNYKYVASDKEPTHIYCHDFDKSGTLDIVLGYYNNGTCFPVRGRQCSSESVPSIKEKFTSYDEFAKASIDKVYGNELGEALHYEAKIFASCYMENKGNNSFDLHLLPDNAQFAPVNGIIIEDMNNDGALDIVIAGNLYVSEVETGRADAGIGLYLKGNGKGMFEPVHVTESGFFSDLDVKDLVLINLANGSTLILVANNNDSIQAIKVNYLRSTKGDELALNK